MNVYVDHQKIFTNKPPSNDDIMDDEVGSSPGGSEDPNYEGCTNNKLDSDEELVAGRELRKKILSDSDNDQTDTMRMSIIVMR